jgi:hypothetical protein
LPVIDKDIEHSVNLWTQYYSNKFKRKTHNGDTLEGMNLDEYVDMTWENAEEIIVTGEMIEIALSKCKLSTQSGHSGIG